MAANRIVWITDPHLSMVELNQLYDLLDQVNDLQPGALLISGDIAESRDLLDFLQRLDAYLACPTYFVLGNHDYYYGSIEDVRQRVVEFCEKASHLRFLTQSDAVRLSPRCSLVGHDGWADGRLGNYERSYVIMLDYALIHELAGLNKEARWSVLKRLGDQAADHIRRVLPAALAESEEAILLTHVPPLREACWHQGQISDDEWAPHFTCKAMGDALLEIMAQHPAKRLTVLCGHTHGAGTTQPLDNLVIHTGGAQYGKPAIARVFELR